MSNVVLLKSDFLSCDQWSYIGTKLRNLEKHNINVINVVIKVHKKAPSMPTNDLFLRAYVMNVTSVVIQGFLHIT